LAYKVNWFARFSRKKSNARLDFFENLHSLINIVVEIFWRSGRCRKKSHAL